MTLSPQDSKLFFRLYIPLLGYANQYGGNTKEREMIEARRVLYENPNIITNFINDNPEGLNDEQLTMVAGWGRFVQGSFVLLKELRHHSIFFRFDTPKPEVYCVIGITQPPSEVTQGIGSTLNAVVLLPWNNRIIWDGLLTHGPICGPNYMRSFTKDYQQLKKRGEIIQQLPKKILTI